MYGVIGRVIAGNWKFPSSICFQNGSNPGSIFCSLYLCDHPIPSSSHGPSAPLHQSSGGSVKKGPTQKEAGTPIEPQQVEHNNYPGGMKPRFLLVLWSGKFDSLAWSNHRPKRPLIRCFARIRHVNVVKPIILDLPFWQFYEQNYQLS